MIHIGNVKDENDYKKILQIESALCKEEPACWHWHFGGIGFVKCKKLIRLKKIKKRLE